MALQRSPDDGWLGTLELPGYRAGRVVVKLADLPEVDPEHLYFDLLLLDGGGQPQQAHSGPCPALARADPLDQRSRFVRMVAELVRHAPCEDRGLAPIAPVLDFIRERGIEPDRLATAAQLLDNACSDSAVVASLNQVLELSLGEEEARRALVDIVAKLMRDAGPVPPEANPTAEPSTSTPEPGDGATAIDAGGLRGQVDYVVRRVGKGRARRYLREATTFDLIPRPDMFGV